MAAVLPPNGVVTPSSSLGAGSSLTSRRTATSSLPGPLELPTNALTSKYGASALSALATQQAPVSISNLLTPPSNIPGETLSPVSSGSTSASNPAANGGTPYTPTSYWPSTGSGLTPYMSTGSGSTGVSQASQGQPQQPWSSLNFPPPRGRFSPSLQSLSRTHSGSPTVGPDGTSQSSYELGALPPFPNTLAGSSAASTLAYSMSSPAPLSGVPSQPSPLHSGDLSASRLPPTPTYYAGSQSSGTPQQAQFPAYSSPTSPPNPHAFSTGSGSRISPISAPVGHYGAPRPYSATTSPYGLPASMLGASSHLPLVGMGMMTGFNSGHAAHMQHLYGAQQGHAPIERPFKCDQCPQSFNRNHDLKRHKRIHLSVKPFPCDHCDKSFSRKDALKRHILVKGCGKGHDRKQSSISPDGKEESSDEHSMRSLA